LRRLADAERRLPGLLDDILACARAADPLLLYSRLIVLSGMRRAVPGHISFGMDAMLEFYGGLVTSMPPDEVVARVGTEYNPQVLYEMDRLLREYASPRTGCRRAKPFGKGHRIRWSARGICWSSSSGLTGCSATRLNCVRSSTPSPTRSRTNRARRSASHSATPWSSPMPTAPS
jgi:hypothetical protein